MGYHAVEWAYGLELKHAEKTVLAALCHRVNDENFETFVAQQEVARMIGSEVTKVRRALKVLEDAGVLSRSQRRGRGGYRTSDLIRVNVDTYRADHLPGESPARTNAYKAIRPSLPGDLSIPTVQIAGAINNQLITSDQPEGATGPRSIDEAFDQAYSQWPKKEKRKPSLEKFRKVVKDGKRPLEELTADVIRFGQAYAKRYPATADRNFVPALVVWLNAERWTDDLPAPLDRAPEPASETEYRDGFKFVNGRPTIGGPGGMTRDQYDHYLETGALPNA